MRVTGTPRERFDAKRVEVDGCWVWTDQLTPAGYGTLWVKPLTVYAHRFAYETFVGPIPDGHQIDHLCRNRACVNPSHLEAVLPHVNFGRGHHANALTHAEGRCRRGHSLDDGYVSTGPSGRIKVRCRECVRIKNARRYA